MKKFICFCLFLSFCCCFFVSCGNNMKSANGDAFKPENDRETAFLEESMSKNEVAKDDVEIVRKIIKTYHLTLETKQFAEDAALVITEAEALGGYVSNSSISGNSLSDSSSKMQNAKYTIRIPSELADAYVSKLSSFCNISSSSLTTEDVTDSYYGIQAHMESLIIQERKLTEMLNAANNLQDMIVLDDKLTAVRSEINALNYQLQNLDKSVDYSFVYITLKEVREYEKEEKTYWQKFGASISGSWDNFVNVLGFLLIALVWLFPFLLLFGLIFLVIFLILKKLLKKNQNHINPPNQSK